MRSHQRTPSIVLDQNISHAGTDPNDDAVAASDRPSKRRRTGSSVTESATISTPDVDTNQQTANEARHLIRTELSNNDLLSGHQRSVLETAISFVDHLSQAPVPTITDRSTFDKSMYLPTDISQSEILNVILGSMFVW